jgi:CubicO group peptidase (beta-lactamase class C family)
MAERELAALDAVIHEGLATTAPAISLCVYLEGGRLIERAEGYLDPETRAQPVTPETLFDLASVTKLFTATAFLMQVAEGKVKLNAPLAEVVPEFAAGGPRPIGPTQDPHTLALLPPDADAPGGLIDPASITFHHLLTHTAGLAPWRDLFAQVGPTPPPPGTPDPVSPAERMAKALALIGALPFADAPGRTVRYSDLGLILLGVAVARLDGAESLDEVIASRVTRPHGLDATRFNPGPPDHHPAGIAPTEFDARWRGRRAHGEIHDENACGLGGVAGHAGLFSTAREVAHFGHLWLLSMDHAGFLPVDLARHALREHAVTGVERRGLGWMLRSVEPGISSSGQYFDRNSFGHTGFTGTSLWVDPDRRLVVALMTNRVYHGRDADAIIAFRKALHDAVALYADAMI